MKKFIKFSILSVVLSLISFACQKDFLDRPPQDAYTVDNWYQTADQLTYAVNPLYGGVWFDFQRSWLNIGDVLAGNFHKGAQDPFYTFSVNEATGGLRDAYASLWMGVAYANSVVENVREKTSPDVSETAKNTALGEALVWKSMGYFFLVRGWGAVPIIESNTALITSGQANSVYRNRTVDVYEYIVRMLTQAADLLPEVNEAGRINKYTAYGLLAKVYLTRSGLDGNGSRNADDLTKAKEFAAKVINESGLTLDPDYSNLFTISKGNYNSENLLSWHWIALANNWGSQNAIQADLAVQQLSGVGDGWGTWSGPSIFLQGLFGEDATKTGSANRVTNDTRRKSTMMMDGDHYSDLNRDKGGLTVNWDGGAVYASPTGAWARKHVVGSQADHLAESGTPMYNMKTSLATHLLRLSDVYLVYAEAILGNSDITSDPEALKAFNAVRRRAIPAYVDVNSVTFDDIFTERIKELAFEGDNWYDYVRLHYYKPTDAVNRLNAQDRGYYNGNAASQPITLTEENYKPKQDDFTLPIPEVDKLKNPNLMKDPVPYDFSQMGN